MTEQKGFFPYEWFDDIGKLEATALPPHESYYSQLKGSNISEEEYAYCQRVWRDQQMQIFRDFLVWYNNLDVQPFVKAVEKFQNFYFQKGIDVFKTASSSSRGPGTRMPALPFSTRVTRTCIKPSKATSWADRALFLLDITASVKHGFEVKSHAERFSGLTPMSYTSMPLVNPCRLDRSCAV